MKWNYLIDHISSVKFTDKVKDIYTSSGKTFVTGVIEDEDDDGIRYLRLGSDLVMVDIKGLSLKKRIVEIETDEIKIFPI